MTNGTLWLLLLLPLAVTLGTQQLMRSTFRRYRGVRNQAGLEGGQIARRLLDARGLQNVRIEVTPGDLTDNYDGEHKRLSLSHAVAEEPTVSALGVAAHEVGHAYQDAAGNRAYRARRTIGEPLARLSPYFSFAFIGGYWLGIPSLVVLSLAYVAGLVIFALATLPVEIGASRWGVHELERDGLTDASEERGVRRVLTAAALTYVVGLLDQLGYFLVLVVIAAAMHRVATS